MKSFFLLVLSAAVSGCAVQLHGNQAAGGGTTTATSSAVVASASGSNARVAFSSGQPVPLSAPGGQLSGTGAGVVAAVVVVSVVAEFLYWLAGGEPPVKPLPPDARISHTCSCYGWQPP